MIDSEGICLKVRLANCCQKEKAWCMVPHNALWCLRATVDGDIFAWGWGGSQGTHHGGDGLSSGGQLVGTVPCFPSLHVHLKFSLEADLRSVKIIYCTRCNALG